MGMVIYMKKYIVLIAIGIAIMLLAACSDPKEDKARIDRYLDNVYGKNEYTLEQNPKNKRYYIVRLKKYPGLKFNITVSHQPFMDSFVWDDFDEVFTEHVIKTFQSSTDMGKDHIEFLDPELVYSAQIKSIDELKTSYDRFMAFINMVREKYTALIDVERLPLRFDIRGIRFKGDVDKETRYIDIGKAEKGKVNVKSFEELYADLAPKVQTHAVNPNGVKLSASSGRTFLMGSDTFEDCLYKVMDLDNPTGADLSNIVLQPGEVSQTYLLKKKDEDRRGASIEFQVKNMTDAPCSLYDATLYKMVVSGSDKIFIKDKSVELIYDERREWIDPYKAFNISKPKTAQEKADGVVYKNTRVLFMQSKYTKDVYQVVVTFIP